MGYLHFEVKITQCAKKNGAVSGDVAAYDRTPSSTTLICSDGIGSGMKAYVAANLCVSRMRELLRREYSLREAFGSVVRTMQEARGSDLPYAVFTLLRVLPDGAATVLSYEMPPPLYLGRNLASVIKQRVFDLEGSLVGEGHLYLEPGEGILVMSDGITQAGLGAGLPMGWETEGVHRFVRDRLSERTALEAIPSKVLHQARQYWGRAAGDDCTVCLVSCRAGKTVTILSGPPVNREQDAAAVRRFLNAEGQKVICGATTAKVAGRVLGKPVQVEQDSASLIEPPRYFLEGVDLVTEGAVTLNQVYNILEEDPSRYEEDSAVARFCLMLREADRVRFLLGGAPNLGGDHISFRQQGVLPRGKIVPLLADALRKMDKLVVIEEI